MLKSKCILNPRSKHDGLRISVMSRHTLSDGVTLDKRITSELYDSHIATLAPLPTLVGMYYRKEINWSEYKSEYLRYLNENIKEEVVDLISLSMKMDITLLCIEESPEFCHRKLLLEFAHKLAEEIKIDLKICVE